jgi:multidrug efflux pump subunit AcrA (membrane-fusion protein)
MKAKIRKNLEVSSASRQGLGTQLADIGRSLGGVNIELKRDSRPVKLASYPAIHGATYKARIALDQQHLISPTGQKLQAGAGMQVAVEIHQGRRTVLEYLQSPVAKAVQEAGREK